MKIKPIYPWSEICIYIIIEERITALVYFAVGKHDKISERIAAISHSLNGSFKDGELTVHR